MNKQELEARAKRRQKWAQTLVNDQNPADGAVGTELEEEIGRAWLRMAVEKWNPTEQNRVPAGVPVDREFKVWVDEYLKRSGFRARKWSGFSDMAAKEVAHWIDTHDVKLTGLDYPNPLEGVEKEKNEGYVRRQVSAFLEKEADTIYGPVRSDDRYRNMYSAPEEWARTSPTNPGYQMQRVGPGIYQDPVSGETFEYNTGVINQTNPGWNASWPQAGFLTSPNQNSTRASGGTYDEDSEKKLDSNGVDKGTKFLTGPGELYANVRNFTKKAQEYQVDDKVFGPVQTKTRYSPDHPGVQMFRVTDDVWQDPITNAIYDFSRGFTTEDGAEHHGGSVANMTPDDPSYYQSPHPFLQVSQNVQGFTKKGKLTKEAYASLENRFVFDLSHALTNNSPQSVKALDLVIKNVMQRGQPLAEAIRDAYTVVDQSDPISDTVPFDNNTGAQPADIEVLEDQVDQHVGQAVV